MQVRLSLPSLAALIAILLAACSQSDNDIPTQPLPEGAERTAEGVGCGRVTIAEMNWNSAALMANIDQFILQHGFDCDARLVAGDTMPTGTSMVEKGEPDIAPELWSNSMRDALERGVAEGRLKLAGQSLSQGGEEGFWVPAYMVKDKPELATISGVRANASLFTHPEDPDKSMFMGCPAGWNCQITATNLFSALALDEAGFALVDPGSGAALSGAIAKAYERQEPWFGYYWAPTAVLGKYAMVKVDFESGINEQHYLECISQEACSDPRPTMYPPSPVHTVTTSAFAKAAPEAFSYLQRRAFTNDEMNGLLAWMETHQADGVMAAQHFLRSHQALWTSWLTPDVVAKVSAAMAAM